MINFYPIIETDSIVHLLTINKSNVLNSLIILISMVIILEKIIKFARRICIRRIMGTKYDYEK